LNFGKNLKVLKSFLYLKRPDGDDGAGDDGRDEKSRANELPEDEFGASSGRPGQRGENVRGAVAERQHGHARQVFRQPQHPRDHRQRRTKTIITKII